MAVLSRSSSPSSGAATLADLAMLAEFRGTSGLPEGHTTDSLMSFFGPLLTHPHRVTFQWAQLLPALQSYFSSSLPAHLDPNKITSGWSGLGLIVTAFKRLEVLENPAEMDECHAWLSALKLAAVRRRTASLSYSKPSTSTSTTTSFERGSDATRSPPISTASLSPEPSRPRMEIILDRSAKRGPDVLRGESPSSKRRRGNSIGQISVLPPRARDSTVSTSQLSSFADFSDHHDIDPLSSSEDEDDDEAAQRKPSNVEKIQVLALRLSQVTGIPLDRCVETISRFPNEDLSAINPNAPIPAQFLPPPPPLPASRTSTKAEPVARASHSRSGSTSSSRKAAQTHGASTTPSVATNGNAANASTTSTAAAGTEREGKGTRHQRPHDPNRPGFSYSALIGQAILAAPDQRLRLSEIYDYVTENYPYYQKNQSGWQNSIRHNLSLQPVFTKIPDPSSLHGTGKKGCLWTIISGEEWRFAGGGWLKMDKASHTAVKPRKNSLSKPSPSSPRKGATNARRPVLDEEEEDEEVNGRLSGEDGGDVGGEQDGLFSDDELE